jgi:hypothetical protein
MSSAKLDSVRSLSTYKTEPVKLLYVDYCLLQCDFKRMGAFRNNKESRIKEKKVERVSYAICCRHYIAAIGITPVWLCLDSYLSLLCAVLFVR